MLLAGGEEEEIILKYARALFHSVSLSKAGETVLPEPNLLVFYRSLTQLLWWLLGKESNCKAGDTGDLGSIPVLGKIFWKRKWQPTPVFLPGKSQGQRSLTGYSPWGHKELDTPEQLTQQQ